VLKRLFDIFLSSIGIIASSPLWILFGLAIIFEDGLPIFYAQERVGKGDKNLSGDEVPLDCVKNDFFGYCIIK
jgi:lipopolysaccharide/colanic/teichoic acid biosynthesis glycosyltransferase